MVENDDIFKVYSTLLVLWTSFDTISDLIKHEHEDEYILRIKRQENKFWKKRVQREFIEKQNIKKAYVIGLHDWLAVQ
jgi:hypothetical protein